jgi:hypothetical protein
VRARDLSTKSGDEVPAYSSFRWDKPAEEADRLETLVAMISK